MFTKYERHIIYRMELKYNKYSLRFPYKYTVNDLMLLSCLENMLTLYYRDNKSLFDAKMRMIMVDIN